jgi:two-component system chemotaxis response regulator CheY
MCFDRVTSTSSLGKGYSSMAIHTLIVEDSAVVRHIIKTRFEDAGCRVVAEAGNAFEGLNLFRSLGPELVTLDLLMPQFNGIDAKTLFRAIRKESPQVAVIVISAQPIAKEGAAYLAEGALAYFEKPFINAQTLIATLERIFPDLHSHVCNTHTRRL